MRVENIDVGQIQISRIQADLARSARHSIQHVAITDLMSLFNLHSGDQNVLVPEQTAADRKVSLLSLISKQLPPSGCRRVMRQPAPASNCYERAIR